MAPVNEVQRMPVLGVPHGGGPMPLLGEPGHKSLTKWLSELGKGFAKPRSILILSAHWEVRDREKPRWFSQTARLAPASTAVTACDRSAELGPLFNHQILLSGKATSCDKRCSTKVVVRLLWISTRGVQHQVQRPWIP